MKKPINGTACATVLAVLGLMFFVNEASARVVLATKGPRYHGAPSGHEFVFEGGLAEPIGDQKDELGETIVGLGSSTGYQLGIRYRQYLGEFLAVTPAFHYTRFGSASGFTSYDGQSNVPFSVRTSNYRYGVDCQAFVGNGSLPARLFLTGGIALVNNRLRDEAGDSYFEDTVNTLAYSAGVGFKLNNIEICGEYSYNRFDTNKFSADLSTHQYNWDYFILRFGLSFGR